VDHIAFHPLAAAEYARAYSWYSARSTLAAERFEQAIEQAVRYVAMHPQAPPQCDERHRFCSTRRYPYGLVYRITPKGIRVIAVAHHRQLPGFWLNRD